MDIDERLAAIEARLAALEGAPPPPAGPPPAPEDQFWALHGLGERLPDEAGAVLYTGDVTLPSGENWKWQWGIPTGQLLERDWSEMAAAITALGHPVRLMLLREVLNGTRSATDLGAREGVGTTGQLYHHLKQLVSAGWLRSSSRGHYEVPGDRVVPLMIIISACWR